MTNDFQLLPPLQYRLDETQETELEDAAHEVGMELRGEIGPGHLSTAAAALTYMLAGNATFTLRSLKTGARYTYKVQMKQDDMRKPPVWFVKLLTGPENEADYQYLGMIMGGQFRLTKASKATGDAPSVKAIRWTLEKLTHNQMPGELEIWHEGRCGKCGRKLTVPESIALGLGPECAGKVV